MGRVYGVLDGGESDLVGERRGLEVLGVRL